MKKLLLILLCLPMIGFGQVDCGKEPQEPKKRFGESDFKHKNSKTYRDYKRAYNDWTICNGSEISKHTFSTIDSLTYDMVNDIEFCKEIKNSTKFKTYTTKSGTTIRKGDTLYIGKPSSRITISSY